MIQELESVILTTDLPEYRLLAGDIGTVVLIHSNVEGYEVEFIKLDGQTIAVATVFAAQVRSVAHGEIAHAG